MWNYRNDKLVLAVVIVLMICASLVSCDSNESFNPDETMLGTWELVSAETASETFSAEDYLEKINAEKLQYIFEENGVLTMVIYATDGRIVKDNMIWEAGEEIEKDIFGISIASTGTGSQGILKYYKRKSVLKSESEQAKMSFEKVK